MLHSFRRLITEIGMMDVGTIWSDILFTSHAVASRGSTRKGAHLMKRSSYREQDYAFGQLMLTLRTRIGLTQARLADLLGVSGRAVAEWEGGLAYPKTDHFKAFLALCVRQQAFPAGREAEEIRA